jgi:site-specific DNA-methyltransferase (adenine-specific)
MPPKLVEPCILAGSPADGVVLDPFAGSGTTLAVAVANGRSAIGIEIGAEYLPMIQKRVEEVAGGRAMR